MRAIIILFILNVCTFAQMADSLTITEVMFYAPFENGEFIEIHNFSSSCVFDLTQYEIVYYNSSPDKIIPQLENDAFLYPGEYAVIFEGDLNPFESPYSEILPMNSSIFKVSDNAFGSSGMSNSSERRVSLRNKSGAEISFYTYSPDNPQGYSDEKILPETSDSTAQWNNSLTYLGTPGFINSISQKQFDGAISEFHSLPLTPLYGEPFSFYVKLKNSGTKSAAGRLILRTSDTETDSICSITILPGDSLTLENIFVSFGITEEATYYLSFICNNDQNLANNYDSLLLRPAVPEGGIIINEIMYDPNPDMPEWIEIFNPSSHSFDLNGVRISDASSTADLDYPKAKINPGEYAVISSGIIPNLDPDTKIFSCSIPALNNSGDKIVLKNSGGEIIDSLEYSPDFHSNILSSSSGISLERIATEGKSIDPSNWSSSAKGSTPGEKNSIAVSSHSFTSELNIYPNPFSPDNDGFEDFTSIAYKFDFPCSAVRCRLYDRRGILIRDISSPNYSGSSGLIIFDGKTDNGIFIRPGIYIILFEIFDLRNNRHIRIKKPLVAAVSG